MPGGGGGGGGYSFDQEAAQKIFEQLFGGGLGGGLGGMGGGMGGGGGPRVRMFRGGNGGGGLGGLGAHSDLDLTSHQCSSICAILKRSHLTMSAGGMFGGDMDEDGGGFGGFGGCATST